MADTRGVFRLKAVRNDILSGEYVTPNEAFFGPQVSNRGYMLGGSSAPGNVSTTDRIDFTLDASVAVPGANLTSGRFGQNQGGSTNTVGYTIGGKTTPSVRVSTVDKITFATETTEQLPAAGSQLLWTASGSGNNLAGYYCGSGSPGGPPIFTYCQKLTYSTETSALAPSANLTATRYNTSSTGNQIFGYWIGGTPGPNSTADKLTYGTDTMSAVTSARLPTNGYGRGTSANQTTAIYAGGATPGVISNVEKVNFSSDTSYSAPAAQLTVSRAAVGGSGNSVSGYYYGGYSPSRVTTTDKLSYASDTVTVLPGAQLSVARDSGSSMSARNNVSPPIQPKNLINQASFNFGYINGGSPGSPYLSIVDKVFFNTDTVGRVQTANLSTAGANIGASASLDAAYAAGGARTAQVTIVDKITMATDTAARVPGADLSQASQGLAGCGNKDAGYYAGGTPGTISTMNKLTYSTDSTQGLPAGALSAGRPYLGATSNQRFGYWIGGSGPLSTVDKMDFGTDLTGRVPSADLPTPQQLVSGTAGNEDAGYICGGGTPNVSTCTRLDYNFDTSSVIPTAAMSSNRQRVGGTGNINNGYYCGGTVPGDVSTVDKLNFTNDTNFSLPNAKLTGNRSFTSGSSSRMYGNPQSYDVTPTLAKSIPGSVNNAGYIGGGLSTASPGHRSDFDKIHMSTDTIEFLPSTQLSAARYRHTASASSTAGYYGGGRTSPGFVSTMDKLTFSTESCAAVPGAALSDTVQGCATASCETHSYWAGGAPGYRSDVDKLLFSNDTTSLLPGTQLESNTYFGEGGCASFTAMYMGGGVTASPISSVARITFSNDTRTQVPSGALIASKYAQAAGHNTTRSYFVGGNPGPVSTVSKFTYATETTEQAVTYPQTIYEHTAFGNQVKGYFANGNNPATNYLSNVYKLDYATETFGFIGYTFLSQGNADSAACSAREGGASHVGNNMA